MWSGIWSVGATRDSCWTWIWSMRDTLRTGTGNGWLISMLENLNFFCLTRLITLMLLMWKCIGLFLTKNHLLRCRGCLSLLNRIRALTLSLFLKLPPKKLEPWFVLRISFSWVCPVSMNVPYSLARSAAWKFWRSCRSEYVGFLVLNLHSVLNPWLIAEM